MNKPILYAGTSPFDGLVGREQMRQAVRRFHQVRESAPAAVAERTVVRESSFNVGTVVRPGRMLLRLITAGWSLNGNLYPAEVLRRDGPAAWTKGTRCYVDHASDEEEQQHPSGSVKNLAAVLTENARWDEATQSLVAECRLFEPWRGPLSEMAEEQAVGMSIRAWVTGEHGERDGREGFIVEAIPQGRSVDFVTVPAAGGGIISVLEAVGNRATAEAASLGGWLESRLHLALTAYADDMYGDGRLTRAERITLSAAIGDGLQAWTARVEAEAPQLFQRDRWTEPETVISAAAEDTPAVPPSSDQPATENVPDGTPPPEETPEHEEEPVSGSQTGAPPEQAGTATVPDTVTTTESAPSGLGAEQIAAIVASAVAEATGPLQQQLRDLSAQQTARESADRDARNRQAAGEAVTVALAAPEHADVAGSITSRVTARVTAAVPATAEGAVDTAALGDLITGVIADEALHVRRERANALAQAGVGLPYGVGGTPSQESEDDGLDADLERFFSGALGLSEAASKIAAKGR